MTPTPAERTREDETMAGKGETHRWIRRGDKTRCTDCDAEISRGALAYRHRRRAETYYERCHAGAQGMVSWYYCETCGRKEERTR